MPNGYKTILSVVIPTYNERDNIDDLIGRLTNALNTAGLNNRYEFIFIDDHSPDGTAEYLRSLEEKFPLKVLYKQGRKGKAYSLLEGFAKCSSENIAMIDADLQYPPEAIPEMLQQLRTADIVVGKRIVQHTAPYRKFLSRTYALVFGKLLLGLPYDVQSGLKVFRKEVMSDLNLNPTKWGFDYEFLFKAKRRNCKIGEVDISFSKRMNGESKVTYMLTGLELAWGAVMLRIRHLFKAHEIVPFRERDIKKKGRGFTYKGREFTHHTELEHHQTAFYNLIGSQKLFILSLLALIAVGLFINWHTTVVAILAVLTAIYFADLLFNLFLVYRSFSAKPEIIISPQELVGVKESDLPTYTILCPLYKEWQVVPQFLDAMNALDYPKEKLQILLLLEENDNETIRKVEGYKLPREFQVIVVPHSLPKTKPKAMNYGLLFAHGEYVVVYDAEDMPEPNQLKKAVLAFEKVSANTVCVQAKLNYYNPEQNILTRIFTAEYSLWFDLVLPGLQSINAPIPLGGTSNHFRLKDIKALKGWDAFNVTEDCDLGIRLAEEGYRTAIMDSTTYEEANSNLGSWLKQRSRWIKGYIQTYFVHMRSPKHLAREGRRHHLPVFHLVVGGKIMSIFINPLMWVITASYFLFRAEVGTFIESFFPTPVLYIGVTAFVLGNFLYFYYYMIGCAKRGYDELIKYVFFVPFYWLGMSIAAWKALYEIIVDPHYWAKTMHGLHLPPVKKEVDSVLKPVSIMGFVNTPEPVSIPEISQKSEEKEKKRVVSAGGALVGAFMVANLLNFIFSLLLGRMLTLEQFGVLIFLNTISYIISIFSGALVTTVNHRTAFLAVKSGVRSGINFLKQVRYFTFLVAALLAVFWILGTGLLATTFQISEPLLLLSFAPVIILGVVTATNRGFLWGNLRFLALAAATIIEAGTKLLLALALVVVGLPEWVALAIPGSVLITFAVVWLFTARAERYFIKKGTSPIVSTPFHFPGQFFAAAFLTGLASASFLIVDIVLVKHYLNSVEAGTYALLSLVGKMIFFLGSLLSGFIITFVARDIGAGRSPNPTFHKIFAGTFLLTALAFIALGPFGAIFLPILLGQKVSVLTPYLIPYALAISLFTISNCIVVFHLARKHYLFSFTALLMTLTLYAGITLRHGSITEIVNILTLVSSIQLGTVLLLHFLQKNGRFIVSNLIDLLNIFNSLSAVTQEPISGKRILIFNWRDTKHTFAGGAEVYIHELAKRWVREGHFVTLFCGNDGKSARNDTVDGVYIVRRGGFYFVYLWAFVYYLLKFRGRFDVIIDCENGIPFFTPFYAKEPVYCLLHHVHQEVFRKYLNLPMALLASVLENRLMPWAYRKSKFITISDSSKEGIGELGIDSTGIEIVHPGVNLKELSPGPKHERPTILYLGRLKAYKSVQVLIEAFKKILERIPEARLVIAGSGEERGRLEKSALKLGISRQVEFTGKVSEGEKVRLLQEAWVFVNPSYIEGWGITTIEANACGTPVVAADVPGLRDSVNNPHCGLLVEHGNPIAFAEEITSLLQNRELRSSMGAEAVKWAKNFDWEESASRMINLLDKRS